MAYFTKIPLVTPNLLLENTLLQAQETIIRVKTRSQEEEAIIRQKPRKRRA